MARGTVVIEVDRCKGCELCTTICPQDILHMSREGFNARGYRPVELLDPTGKCTGCALCALDLPGCGPHRVSVRSQTSTGS